jgi:hypothetical protein
MKPNQCKIVLMIAALALGTPTPSLSAEVIIRAHADQIVTFWQSP